MCPILVFAIHGVNMRRTLIGLGLMGLFLLAPSVLMAKTPEGDWLTSRELLSTSRGYGVANAMVASSAGTTAVWHNPAGIASAMMYSVDAGYMYEHDDEGHGFEVNVVDMKSNPYVGAGFGFVYQHGSVNGKAQHLVHTRLGIAVPLAKNLISLGVTGAYSYIKYDGKKLLSQFTMDTGIIVRPLEWLAVAFAAQNLIVGDYKAYMPRTMSFGAMAGSIDWGINVMFEASFNISAKDIADTGSYGVGLEYVLRRLVPIRLGYRYECDDHHVLAVGLGYRHQEGIFGLDIAYQHHFADTSNELLSGSLNFYF